MLVCLFRGEKKKKKKVLVQSIRIFPPKKFLFSPFPIHENINSCVTSCPKLKKDPTESNKKITFNEHPKLIQKGFQEKLKQTKEKIIGN